MLPAPIESTPILTNLPTISSLPSSPTSVGWLSSPSPLSSQSSASTRHDKIPKPRYYSRAFTHHIQLCDINEFNAVKPLIRDMLDKFLDIRRLWREQDKGAVSALASAACSGSPTFEKYEDNWPILYYCYHYFHSRRSKARNPDQKKPRSPRKCRADITGSLSGVIDGKSRTTREKENVSLAMPVLLQGQSQHTIQPEQALPEVMNGNADSELPASADEQRGRDLQARCGEQEILSFLLSMNPTFGYLLDRFVSAGIESRARLLVTTHWPREERDVFFRTEVRLSPFEWKVVRDKLEAICLEQ